MRDAGLSVLRAGPLVTVQDRGRYGSARFGVARSGPMDWIAHALALHLAGCGVDDPAIEAGPGGVKLRCNAGPVRIGIAGWGGRAVIAGEGGTRHVACPARVTLRPDETIDLRPLAGNWVVLAAHGFDVGAPVLDSWATNSRTGLGPAKPAEGARYPCVVNDAGPDLLYLDPLEGADPDVPIRILAAPQTHLFDAASLHALVSQPFTVDAKRDRQGGRLTGPSLVAPGGHDIVSDALVEGAMQVPGDGQPIVLTADCAPTGGYPKIAVVTRVDLPRIVRAGTGDKVRFTWSDPARARSALAALEDTVADPVPRRRTRFPEPLVAAMRPRR